jgi:hypothetical protein
VDGSSPPKPPPPHAPSSSSTAPPFKPSTRPDPLPCTLELEPTHNPTSHKDSADNKQACKAQGSSRTRGQGGEKGSAGMARYGDGAPAARCTRAIKGQWWGFDVHAWYEDGSAAVSIDPHTGAVTIAQRATGRTLLSTAGGGAGVLLDAKGRLLRSWPAATSDQREERRGRGRERREGARAGGAC